MKHKLFNQLAKGVGFFFYDKPSRILVKQDDTHYVGQEGRHSIHPHVLIFPLTENRKRNRIPLLIILLSLVVGVAVVRWLA